MSDEADSGSGERFGSLPDQYDPHAVEDQTFEYWNDVDAYEQTVEHRAGGESFFFVDGPPYTSGSAHMGTTWNKTLKDAYIRYHRMQGYDVTDRPGYDMHGLPIETRVEENLDFENKKDIEEYGEQNFIEDCREYAEEQLDGLQEDFKSFGVWMDWDNPYKTVTPEYMEAAWWGFANAHERDLVEQGNRSISQCPRCETAIAKNEVEFEVVEDPSIYVKFPLADSEGSLVIWTTTPWTIPANTFVAVDGEGEYVGVRAERDGEAELLYVAEPKLEEVLRAGRYDDYDVVEEHDGEELVGWEYEHPLADSVDHPGGEDAFEVYTAEYVETDGDGTGLVHSAPGHGEEDFERGTELGLDIFCPVGSDGVFEERAGPYTDTFVREANDDIITDLEDSGQMLASETIDHDYGHCWRCDTGIVQIVTDQWFITVTDIKADLLDNIEDSEWYPGEARDSRFMDFVENSPDWNVSRQRYWGIPIPIWLPSETTDGEPVEWSGGMDDAIVVSTREELAERVDQNIDPGSVDLHKGTVDDLTITEDGVVYERVPDVFDVWLDSSVASWGTLDYPEHEERFEELWPADLILEAHDQTRGWFWSQLGMGTTALDEIPYESVLMHGHALMPDGRAMSKSKDILIDPHEVIEKHGVDPMRGFLLSVTPQEDNMRFSWEGVENVTRDLNILWNVFRFPLPYMELDGFDPATADPDSVAEDLETIDEWLLARFNSVVAEMTEHWEAFRQDKALGALREFIVEDLSRYYVQVVRERMWAEEQNPSKLAAYHTLADVLDGTIRLLAPYTPLVADQLYTTLTGDSGYDTVHMCDWPTADEGWLDETLEADIGLLRAVEEAGSNARQQAERKLRWPVTRVVVAAEDERTVDAVDRHRDLLAERLNAEAIELVGPGEQWGELQYSAQADMSKLGPAFGDRAGEVMRACNDARIDEQTLSALEAEIEDALDGEELTESMVEFVTETPEDVSAAPIARDGEDHGVVYVDTALTEAIESEGYAREAIRRIQEMRKELDLDIEAEIRVDLDVNDDRIAAFVAEHEDLIASEVRAGEFGAVEDGHRTIWDVEGVEMEIAIEPLPEATA
jgi:isoleucyl-tRNA synthetase